MISILHIGRNIHLAQKILDLNCGDSLRIKHVYSIAQAEEWLKIQYFQIISFDETTPAQILLPFLLDVWSLKQSTIAAFVSTVPPQKDLTPILSLGLEDCTGENFIDKLKKLSKKIPVSTDILTSKHTSILLLEDLDSPRDIICSLIHSMGFEQVLGVPSVSRAFEALERDPFKYFCIITDINMPERSGLSFIQELRENLAIAYLPVIVLTSDPSEENLLEALKLGITGFLAKPPKRNLLKAELEKAKRLVLLGKTPEIGTTEELRLLERSIRLK